MMRLKRLVVTIGFSAALLLAPLVGSSPAAAASGCDTVAADASAVGVNPVPIAATGSLGANTGAPITVTATNSAGVCVAGATIYLQFDGTGGGTATTGTASCPGGRLTANWLACVTNGQGAIGVSYTTPSTLPNGGTDTVAAELQSSGPTATTSYTYASLSVAGQPLQAQEGAPFSGTVASFTVQGQLNTGTLTATIDWGDGTTSAGTVVGTGTTTFTVTGAHTYAEESGSALFATRVTVTAPSGPTASGGGTALVADAPLAASGTSLSGHTKGALNVVTATFTDADPGAAATDYTATIDWGDGTTSSGTVTADGTGGFSVAGSHTYVHRGHYTVVTSIHDAGGAQVQATGTAKIVGHP